MKYKGKLVVLEGIDKVGKSTQLKNLRKGFEEFTDIFTMHFPTNYNIFGELINNGYLKGSFSENNLYYISSLYANDRIIESDMIRRKLSQGCLVIVDRYSYSNMAFQGARIIKNDYSLKETVTELNDYVNWIYDYEFVKNGIPEPDLIIYFDASIEAIRHNFDNNENDILEDIEFLKDVKEVYEYIFFNNEFLLNKNHEVKKLKCSKEGVLRSKESIYEDLKKFIDNNL